MDQSFLENQSLADLRDLADELEIKGFKTKNKK